MSSLTAIVAGGTQECRNLFNEYLIEAKATRFMMWMLGGVSAFYLVKIILKKYYARIIQQRIEKENSKL